MLDGLPGALTGGVALPLDFVFDEFGVANAFADDALNFVEVCHGLMF